MHRSAVRETRQYAERLEAENAALRQELQRLKAAQVFDAQYRLYSKGRWRG